MTNLLLQRQAPVDAEGKNGVTPLHVAAHYDHQNVAHLLLDQVIYWNRFYNRLIIIFVNYDLNLK